MSIFTRYMAQRFFKPFAYGLALFSLLIFLGDSFDKMNYLLKTPASLGVIFAYLWLEVPYWTIRVFPMATLLATLIALTGFVQSGEWIAVQASGFRTRDFWKPLLYCGLAVTALAFIGQETVLPICYRSARRLWQDSIHPDWRWERLNSVVLMGAPGEFIESDLFLPGKGEIDGPLLERVTPGGVQFQLDAKKALWDAQAGHWVFYDGVERTFVGTTAKEKPFKEEISDLTVPPEQLVPRSEDPDTMSLRELLAYSRHSLHIGVSERELDVAISSKIAYPFANLIICALGIPIALRLRRSPRVISFFVALGVSFLYLWFIEVGRALGMGGGMPPILAGWTANFVFALAAGYFLVTIDASHG